jgi:hypothetical protein
MANSTNRRNINKSYDKRIASGIVIDSGPYIGIVKNNVDPARLGRLEVYIPDLAGLVDGPNVPITVTYASPFGGSTKGIPSPDEFFSYEQQTYGFWAVPPDLDNQVLVTFVAGDISRGYWFACVPNADSRHMLPGISRLKNDKTIFKGSGLEGRGLKDGDVYLPTSEVNLNSDEKQQDGNMLNLDRIAHQIQAEVVLQQGLETDPVRGTITSSSQRESPSRVFGLSTPGRPYPDIAKTAESKQAIDELLNNPDITIQNSQINNPQGRSGGHTLVMDDGDVYGDNDLVRLRTAGGHTILMHDTENIIYITNKDGTAYVELTPNGAVNVYSAKTVSVRSELNIDLHADANVNIQAGDSINCFAEKNIEVQAQQKRERVANEHLMDAGRYDLRVGGQIKIKSGTTSGWTVGRGELWLTGTQVHLNTSGKAVDIPNRVAPLEQYKKQDVKFDAGTKRWVIDDASTLASIATFTPTHEPWSRETGPLQKNNGTSTPSKKQQDI